MLRREESGKFNTDGTIQEPQVTNFFLSMRGQDAIIKFRSLISHRSLIDTPYIDIRLAIQYCISPNKGVVTTKG